MIRKRGRKMLNGIGKNSLKYRAVHIIGRLFLMINQRYFATIKVVERMKNT